jgi:hypothetical protein
MAKSFAAKKFAIVETTNMRILIAPKSWFLNKSKLDRIYVPIGDHDTWEDLAKSTADKRISFEKEILHVRVIRRWFRKFFFAQTLSNEVLKVIFIPIATFEQAKVVFDESEDSSTSEEIIEPEKSKITVPSYTEEFAQSSQIVCEKKKNNETSNNK